MTEEKLIERKVQSQSIFEGRILHVFDDTVTLPNGQAASRELIRHVGAVCVIPLLADGRVIVERQYRYPVGKVLTEIPAGKLNSKEEDPAAAVRRELKEETGYEAGTLLPLGVFYPAAAYSDEAIHMFLAKDLIPGKQSLDADEFLTIEAVPLETLVSQVLAGEIPDIKTQAAVLRAYLMEHQLL